MSGQEQVGVIVKRGGKPCVVEYSEMSPEACERREPPSASGASGSGRLVFGAGNICNHFFSLSFLEDTVLPGMADMYHVAHKKVGFFFLPFCISLPPGMFAD